MLEIGADPERKNLEEKTALNVAASTFGNIEVVNVLLNQGAEKETKDKNGRTPLHNSVLKDNAAVVKALVEKGANKEARDCKNRTPLHIGVIHNHVEVVNILIQNGALLSQVDQSGNNPIRLAALNANVEVFNTILEHIDRDIMSTDDLLKNQSLLFLNKILKVQKEFNEKLNVQKQHYEREISSLEDEISSLQNQISDLESEISYLEMHID